MESKIRGLLLNLFLPQRVVYAKQNPNSQPASNSIYKKGICFNFNSGQCKWPNYKWNANTVPFVQEHIQYQSVSRRCPQLINKGMFLKALTPMRCQDMLPWLQAFPDKLRAQLLIEGFRDVFLLPTFSGQGCTLVNNFKSVENFSDIVVEKIHKEVKEGRMEGPFSSSPFHNFRISLLGIIPKKEKNS